jgi:predicted nuclease of predicted toxin-antitoxin system
MKVLLDENLPHDLRRSLPGHEVYTVAYMKWAGIENGELLALAAQSGFDVLLTKDVGVGYQQHLVMLPVAVVVLRAKTNKLIDLQPLLPALLTAMSSLEPRTLITVG